MIGYGLPMTLDARQLLEKIIAHCSEQWSEADRAAAGAIPPPERLTGRKEVYNDVFHFARRLLAEAESTAA